MFAPKKKDSFTTDLNLLLALGIFLASAILVVEMVEELEKPQVVDKNFNKEQYDETTN